MKRSRNPFALLAVLVMLVASAALVRPASVSASASEPLGKEVVAYWGGWSSDSNRFLARDIPADRLTTLVYFSARLDVGRGTCTLTASSRERRRNIGRRFGASESVDGLQDRRGSRVLRGNLGQLQELRAQYPQLRILASIAMAYGSQELARPAASKRGRERFARSCVDLLIRGEIPGKRPAPGLFDGIDIDWEFPVGPRQRRNFTLLLAEFRAQLDAAGKGYLLTAATPASPHAPKHFQLGKIHRHLDWINLMGYDLHGAWDTSTNFLAPLRRSPRLPDDGLTIDDAVQLYLVSGVPPQKLTLGIPFYGRGWRGVPPVSRGLGQPVRCWKLRTICPARHPDHPGVAFFRELAPLYGAGPVFRDPVAQQVWTYDRKKRVFWTSEDPQTVRAKMAYANELGLRGAMIWEISQDTSGWLLLDALLDGLDSGS